MTTMSKIEQLVTIHANRMQLDPVTALKNCMTFARIVGIIENNGKLVGKNPTSSARGLYQFIRGSIDPAINRLVRYVPREDWMDNLHETKDIEKLNWEQQTLLFLADLLGKRGSDRYMRKVLRDGDAVSMKNAYCVLHHTNPDEATLRRVDRIIYGAINED